MGVYSMKRFALLALVFTTTLMLVLPLVGGGGLGLQAPVSENSGSSVPLSTSITGPQSSVVDRTIAFTVTAAPPSAPGTADGVVDGVVDAAASAPVPIGFSTDDFAVSSAVDADAQLQTAPGVILIGPTDGCPTAGAVTVRTAPSKTSSGGVAGTTQTDLATFAAHYNANRVANCLPPIATFVYDSCMEARLFWMAESPSSDPLDAWGHVGSTRVDGVASVGCDGNLAGGSGNTGATVAQKWWTSAAHRASLYRPGSSVTGVCIALAMTHGGTGDPYAFTRAAARWMTSC